MIWRKPLIYLIAFVVLAGLYVGDRWWTARRRAAKQLSERAFPLNKEDTIELTLVTPDEIITCKKEQPEEPKVTTAHRWVMTQPIQTAADADAIEVILSNLIPALRYGEFKMDETIHLEDYGLDAPTYKLIVKSKDVPQGMTLLVGRQAPQSGKFYAKIESEDKIFSINEYIKDKLDKKPFDLRDRTVLPFEVDDVQRVVLTRAVKTAIEIKIPGPESTTHTTTGWQRKPPEKIVLARTDDDEWQIEEPVAWKGDSIEVENLLRKLKTEKVTSFIDDPTTGDLGFAEPQINLLVEQIPEAGDQETTATTETQALVLLVGDRETSPGKGYYAKRGDSAALVTIGQDLFDALAIKGTKLRDKQLFALGSADVVHFDIEAGKSKVELEKNDQGRWVFMYDTATSVNQELVSDKISSLVNMRAKDFETDQPGDLGEYKLDKPFVRLTIADKDREKVEGLDMGDLATRDGGSVVFGRLRDSKSIVLLDFTAPSEFVLTKDRLIDKSLFSFDEDTVVRAEVSQRPGTTFTLVHEDDTWKMQRAEDEEPQRVPPFWAEDVVRGVRGLQYRDIYKGPLTEEEMGLTSPTLEVVLFGKGNAEIARVVRGLEKGERYYTKIQPDGPVYGVEKSLFQTLESAIGNLLKEQ